MSRHWCGYFKIADPDDFAGDHERKELFDILSAFLHRSSDAFPVVLDTNISVSVAGFRRRYILQFARNKGHLICVIKRPFYALIFECPKRPFPWIIYNDESRAFEPFPDDPLLDRELHAVYYANTLCSLYEDAFAYCYLQMYSALKKQQHVVRCTKTGHKDGVIMDVIPIASHAVNARSILCLE